MYIYFFVRICIISLIHFIYLFMCKRHIYHADNRLDQPAHISWRPDSRNSRTHSLCIRGLFFCPDSRNTGQIAYSRRGGGCTRPHYECVLHRIHLKQSVIDFVCMFCLFVCLFGFNVAFNIICHIRTVSGYDRELNAYFYSAASLRYQIPDTFTLYHLQSHYTDTGATSPSPTPKIRVSSVEQLVPLLTTLVCRGPGSNPVPPDLGPTELPRPVYVLWFNNFSVMSRRGPTVSRH